MPVQQYRNKTERQGKLNAIVYRKWDHMH